MEEKTTLGKFISEKRKELNMTQKDLADKLFVTESAVSKWERGISYPDITLISELCDILKITEHELVTASEDLKQRQIEKRAKRYHTISKTFEWTLNLSYLTAILACFICNIAVNHCLSWFFLVLTSIAVAFSITTLPKYIPKNKGIWTLATFLFTLAMLLMTCCIYTGGNWFYISYIPVLYGFCIIFLPVALSKIETPWKLQNHKALICIVIDCILTYALTAVCMGYAGHFDRFFPFAVPTITYGIFYPVLLLITIRYIKVNAFFRTAICLGISSAFIATANGVVNMFMNKTNFRLDPINLKDFRETYVTGNVNLIVTLSCLLLALLFTIAGICVDIIKKKKAQ